MNKIPIAKELSRPKFTWTKPCAKCPSAWTLPDPESEDIMTWPYEDRMGTIFACAWRLKGYCHACARNNHNGQQMKYPQTRSDNPESRS